MSCVGPRWGAMKWAPHWRHLSQGTYAHFTFAILTAPQAFLCLPQQPTLWNVGVDNGYHLVITCTLPLAKTPVKRGVTGFKVERDFGGLRNCHWSWQSQESGTARACLEASLLLGHHCSHCPGHHCPFQGAGLSPAALCSWQQCRSEGGESVAPGVGETLVKCRHRTD